MRVQSLAINALVATAVVSSQVDGFSIQSKNGLPSSSLRTTTSTQRNALWRHWIPVEEDEGQREQLDTLVGADASSSQTDMESLRQHQRQQQQQSSSPPPASAASSSAAAAVEKDAKENFWSSVIVTGALTLSVTMSTLLMPLPSNAVSGGGLDFAGLDISGQDFSNAQTNYKGKDFTQVIAKGTNFAKSNLQGCRFYKAYLVNADFTGADLRGASLENTSMDGASLKDAIAAGSYFGDSILDVASVENADFTDAQFPAKALPLLCERPDMKGTNPTSGADTRDSAMCL